MQELIQQIKDLQQKLQQTGELLNLAQKKQKLLELEDQMTEKSFWQNQLQAKRVSQNAADLKFEINEFEIIQKETNDLLDLAQEAVEDKDNTLEKDIQHRLEKIQLDFDKLEFKTMLSDKYDNQNAIVAVHAGTGGTDAQDWAEMLERMLLRYCENRKFKVSVLDRQVANEAGIKSVIFEVLGPHAYGYLKSEAGVHRLVRISPFDAEKMRHTSFALVEILPEIEEVEDTELKDEDLKIDTFRSSGHGGQSVNTTDSAVRIKHVPTGITVTCQNERSQLQNKQTALRVLKSKIKQYNETEQEEERKKIRGEFSEAAWGNQIRSYVLHPYKMVKDHRTDYETQDVNSVLNGGLDELVESYLKWSASRRIKINKTKTNH